MCAAKQVEIFGAKGGSDKPKTPTEAPDSLRSVAMAKILIAMGEGEFAGNPTAQDIFLDNTPLQDPQGNMNFPNVKWEFRSGSVEQSYIQGIPSIENETSLGIELRSGTSWVRAISNTELSAVRLRFAWPALQSVDASGNVNGYRIEYKVELSTDGSAYQQVLSEAVDGKTTSTYERTRRIDLPSAASGWLMRVTRVTPNQNNNKIADTMQIAGFTEVIDAKLRYPNTALLYIEFSAEQFRSIPAVTVDCQARKWMVPSNYNPDTRSYTGIWNGTFKEAWTDNPAWITYGITVNDRFGLGRRIKPWQVDKWELYRIAQYCDQLVPNGKGGQEPRFICNLNLQGKADAWLLLRDISAIYRGMTYWAQGQIFSLSDMPRATDFDFAYTRANVIDGKFTYSSASERTRYSRALISYDNPANNYDTDVTAVTDPKLQRRYGDNPLEISAIGCTRESEAQRRGKWALLTNSKDRGISFKVGLDGRIPLPGYVIPVADELLAGRAIGGRISAVAGRAITLDRDTHAKTGDRLILNLPNGKCEGRTVQSVVGRVVTVTVAYSAVPERELVWALDADDLAVPLYRVTSVSRPEPGVFEISAIQYDPSKFAYIDTGARLEERPISVIPITVVAAPASVTVTSNSIVSQGIAVATMTINWPAVNGAVGYDVEWRKDSGNWIKLPRTGATGVDVIGIYGGAYLARVRAVSSFDISSIWRSSTLTNLTGKQGLPPAVSFLTATPLLFGIGLKWGFPAGAEDTQRTELWYGPTTNLGAATKLADLAYPQSDYSMQSLQAGARLFFWARLIDRTGNVGPWYPAGIGVMGQASADAGPILDKIAGQIGETELGKDLLDRIDLIDGPPALPGSVNSRLEELDDQIGEVTDLLQERVNAGETALTAAQKTLTDAQAALQQQINQVSTIAKSGEYQKDKAYAAGTSTRLNDRLYQAKIAVPADATGAKSPPNATYWLDVGQVVTDSNGLATRVSTAESKITSIEGVNTSQGTAITGLNNSLTTTNGNVTAAQTAANAANTLAGGKGKVIVQTGAPAAADQLAQNLWIDITGGANTPKRWTGSAWAAVTDKVATDAAAAAANALSVANTKADAAALTSLTTRVESTEGTISSQGTAITGLNNSLTTTNGNVTAAQTAANAANTLAGGKGKVIVQTGAPAVADQLVQNLWIDITGGANTPKRWTGSAWAAVTDKVATDAASAAANALSLANTKADAAALTSLATRVESAEGTISSQGTSITGLNNSLTTTNGNVTAAQNAANAANTLAGGKGKVIVQTGAPAAVDQQVQNLWIDITGGANTPKRWTGLAWAVVTDKVATDAAAAAANALSVANTKADAAALTSLTTRVTSAEGTISSQGTSITGLNNSLTTTNTNVTAAQNAANAANTLAGGKGKVIVQTGAPAVADQQMQNLWIDITGGANTPKRWTGGAWAPVTDKVATDAAAAAANALSVANTKADAAALTALNSRVTSTEGAITSQSDSLTQLNNSLTRFGDNSPTSVYQSLFNGLAVDTWAKTQGSSLALDSLSNVEGNISGATLTIDIPAAANWWGATNKKVRFDPARLYKLSVRVQQVSVRAGTSPTFYAGLDCFADDGATRVNTNGANSPSSSHYLLASAKTLVVGEWTELVTYVKGHTTGVGGSGLGTIASPKPLKAGSRYISPMLIAGYDSKGGVVALDYFTIDDVTDQVQIDATSAALASLDSTVTQQGTTLTSQGNSLTSLNNSLTTTNTNVTAAQNAANAANTLAGGKGKVIVQTGAPAVADQQVQNLWIDITGGANTPKRWTGSAWAAVTDKVATDAAAVAANALSVANTKADAAALTSLTTRVTSAEGTISSQGTSITGLNNSLTTTNTNVTAAQNAANAANTLAGGKGKVIVQTGAPAAADQQVQNLWIDITGGANTPKRWTGSAWAAVTDKVATDAATAAANALSVANTKADAAAVTALNSRVSSAEGTITSQSDSLTQLNNSLSSLQGDVSGLGLDPAPNALWQFDTGVEGWTNGGSTVAWADGQVTISSTGTDPTFTSPGGLAINGALYSKVRARVTRIAGAGWDGKVFYATPSHTVSSSYYKSLPNPMLAVGQSTVLEWDMAALSVGGSDWVSSTITYIRLDIGGGSAADVFAVDWVVVGRMGPGASSAALSSIDSKVTQQGTTLTSQGTSLTSLTNSLTTTNTNVTAAQTAANAANTLAGGKGKVIVQTGAPAVADQQVQNLWIDITGGANTPKRWTGSAWAAVTDKVAADAAAAAASALTVANTKADASAVSSLTTRVTSTEQQITAQATKLDGIYVQVNPDMAGDSAGFAGSTTSFVGVWTEQSARIEEGILAAKRVDTVEVTANLGLELGQQGFDLGQQNSGVVQQVSAVVQQVSEAQIAADGKASAMWAVKLQVNAEGQYVAAGVGLGIENGPAGLQSQFLVSADRFAVVNGINGTLSSPFVVQNGQVFMRSAFIEDGTITNAKIGDYISSSDYIFGQRGWAIYKSGGFEMNGPNTGQGRMALNSSSLKFYHPNGNIAIDLSV